MKPTLESSSNQEPVILDLFCGAGGMSLGFEMAGYHDRFRFIGPFTRQFYQVGNAVPPLLARAVAEAILPGVLAGGRDPGAGYSGTCLYSSE